MSRKTASKAVQSITIIAASVAAAARAGIVGFFMNKMPSAIKSSNIPNRLRKISFGINISTKSGTNHIHPVGFKNAEMGG